MVCIITYRPREIQNKIFKEFSNKMAEINDIKDFEFRFEKLRDEYIIDNIPEPHDQFLEFEQELDRIGKRLIVNSFSEEINSIKERILEIGKLMDEDELNNIDTEITEEFSDLIISSGKRIRKDLQSIFKNHSKFGVLNIESMDQIDLSNNLSVKIKFSINKKYANYFIFITEQGTIKIQNLDSSDKETSTIIKEKLITQINKLHREIDLEELTKNFKSRNKKKSQISSNHRAIHKNKEKY